MASKMRYCKKCLQPDTRPGVLFDENQICYACKYEEQKKKIDWAAREQELHEIAKEAKRKARERKVAYDCVIGVSGGKDSTFQAVYAKEKLGLNCLLVNCVPDNITEVGRKNMENLAGMGFDVIHLTANPKIAKKLALKGFVEYGNILKASEYALWASAYIIADKFNIPLIIQGENAAITLGTVLQQEATDDAYSIVQINTLKGCHASDWIDEEIKLEHVSLYDFPSIESLISKDIKAIFLQYYTKEWSQVYNADFSIARGLLGRTSEDLHDIGRYRRYAALDSDLQIVNQMLKYLKFGFGCATDDACYDIREGRLTREDAVWYVKEYDGLCARRYILNACNYLGITEDQFWDIADQYVNKDLFQKNSAGEWTPKFTVGEDFDG